MKLVLLFGVLSFLARSTQGTPLTNAITAAQLYIAYEAEFLTYGPDPAKLTIAPDCTAALKRKATLDEFLQFIQKRVSDPQKQWKGTTGITDASDVDKAVNSIKAIGYKTESIDGTRYRPSEFTKQVLNYEELILGTSNRLAECFKANNDALKTQLDNYKHLTEAQQQERLRDGALKDKTSIDRRIAAAGGNFKMETKTWPNPNRLVGIFKVNDVQATLQKNSGKAPEMLEAIRRYQYDGFADDGGNHGETSARHYKALMQAQKQSTRFAKIC